MSKIIDLAKKLKALADSGVGGEKDNAAAMLSNLLKKHNISISDIEGNEVAQHRFKLLKEHERLFMQVVVSQVPGAKAYDVAGNRTARKHITIVVMLTASQAIEVQAKFDFYLLAWERDLDTFFKAFIHKNKLARPLTEDEENEPEKELTSEEKAEAWRLANMMGGLDRHHFHKQIGAKGSLKKKSS